MTDTAFSLARMIMRQEFQKGEGQLLYDYETMVATLLMERFNKVNFQEYEWRNNAAKDILELIFDIKPTRIHYSNLVNEEPEFDGNGD